MARTPLLRTLQKLIRDCRDARSEGASLVEIRSRRRNKISRRDFMIGSSTLAAAAALPARVLADNDSPTIAIVGGGIAGLTCALTLADRGIASTVYEASNRIGGRMMSNSTTWAEGQVSEWCGELIDTGHKTIRRLANRFNLPLDDLIAAQPDGSDEVYYFFQNYYPFPDAEKNFLALVDVIDRDLSAAGYPTRYDDYTPEGYMLDNMSIYDWIESRIPGGHQSPLGQLLDVAYNIEYGAEATDQSALNLLYLLGYQSNPNSFSVFGESDERFHIRGGNQRLPVAIAEYLGNGTVKKSYRLQRIRKLRDDKSELTFLVDNVRQEIVVADIVVMAIPFAVLRELDYANAGFRQRKHHAIQQLGRGRNGKLQLQFNRRVWNGEGAWPGIGNGTSYSDTGYQASWDVTRAQGGDAGIMVLYSGGDVTGSMATDRPFATASYAPAVQDANNGLNQLAPVYPGIAAHWNGRVTQSIPHLSANFRASYSYYRVGQYTQFGGVEGEREGNVYFCGEHTSQDFQGYMEGGASEGKRVGKDVARKIRRD